MKKSFITDIELINKNIREAEKLLNESINFCEEEYDDTTEYDNEAMPENDDDFYNDVEDENNSVESYIDHIRKYSLNGLSALCDTPDSEEYQMLKKIFQMCDKKPEKKDAMVESHRLFGISKDNKAVLFETHINNTKDFVNLKNILINESKRKGINPSTIRLVSENKIIF